MLRPMTVCLFAPMLRRLVYTLVYTNESSRCWPRLSAAHRRFAAPRQGNAGAVDSRDKPLGIGGPPHSPYNHNGPAESPANSHALSVPVPRRAACPASGLGRRGAARETEEARPRMGRPLALQPGKDP